MITILDYGAGNLRSVQNTLSEIGAEYTLVRDAAGILAANKIILPGVGHFGQMMRALDQMKVRAALLDTLGGGVPFLGICLGLQALFESSDEAPELPGLGLFQGAIRRFSTEARVPHMGWNTIEPMQFSGSRERRRQTATVRATDSKLLLNLSANPYLYFAHSYYAPICAATAATCTYTVPYTAVLESKNIYGVQFHPEKSGALGLQIVRNFVEVC